MRIGNLKKLAGASLVAAIVAFAATPADAAFKLAISTDTSGSVVITDNGDGDMNNAAGIIQWSGKLGGFTFLASIAQSKPGLPIVGGGSELDSNFVVTGGAGTATIALTDTGYTDLANGGAVTGIGGTNSGSTVQAWAWFDGSNLEFGQGTLIGALGPFAPSITFSGNSSKTGLGPAPFSLTSVVQVTNAPGSGGTTTGNHNIRVPEPALLALFGLGLLGVARRRQR